MMITNITIRSLAGVLLLGFSPFIISAQTPTVNIATWKNDAKGAYSLIHDDYGDPGVDGIWQYADTICSNRGIKFTFGAIANSCESSRNINGYSTPYGYAKNVMMAKHNHEIMSHSHTHDCAVGNAGWFPCDASPGEAWGEDVDGANFHQQVVEAHNSIESNTGFASKYFIYPFDRFTDAANDTLKKMGYLGTRTGWDSPRPGDSQYYRNGSLWNGYNNSDEDYFQPDADGFFRTSVRVFDDVASSLNIQGQTDVLNNEVDNAINNSLWSNRELHNVGTTGWGSVTEEAYRAHIIYLKQKVDAGDLWVGTVSEFLTYQMQKLKYSPSVSYDQSSNKVLVSWNSINAQYNVNITSYLSNLTVKSPITLIVDMDGLIGSWDVKQGNTAITDFWESNGKMYINVYPSEGDVEIYKSGNIVNQTPYIDNNLTNYNSLALNFPPFTIDLKTVFEDLETSDNDLIYTYSGNTNINVSIENGIATISSVLDWEGTENVTFTVEDEGGLTVSDYSIFTVLDIFTGQTPYSGAAIDIPGRVESEDYDIGAAGVAYNEVATNYEPDPSTNPYRPNSDPDIANFSVSNYGVGYIEDTEWMEYTINVNATGWYNVIYRIAQPTDQFNTPLGKIKLSIDNNEWIESTDMIYTSGWSNYEDVEYAYAKYLTVGKHLLKVEFERGNVNIDYIDILDSPTIASEEISITNFSIYPNPASSILNLKGDFKDATIFNQVGKVVLNTTKNKIDVSDFAGGVYCIKFNNASSMIKFIITK
jgi:hypothetical protein